MMHKASENLQTAIERGRTDIVRTIVEACQKCEAEEDGKDLTVEGLLNTPCTAVGTLLHLATKLDHADIVRTLLAGGADPGVENDEGQTAFEMASSPNVCEVYNGELLQAVASSNVDRVNQLVTAGVEVNLLDCPESRNTPLHWAVTYGNKDMVQCLCKHKAKLDATNSDGATALHDAITRGKMDIIEELIRAGASTTVRATNGKWSGRTVKDLAVDMTDLKALLDKYRDDDDQNTAASESLMNGSVNADDSFSEDGLVNGHTSDVNSLTPGGPESFTGKIHTPPLTAARKGSQAQASSLPDKRLHLLWPTPQKISQGKGSPFIPREVLPIFISNSTNEDTDWTYVCHEMGDIWWAYSGSLHDIDLELEMNPITNTNLQLSDNCHVVCEVNKQLFHGAESYRIHITTKQTKIQASDIHGLFHAVNTFMQLMVLCQEDGIPPLQIHDWPSIRDRGVLLDLSKGRIPTMDTLRNIIIILASVKVNQVQLYMRFKSDTESEDTWQLPYPQTAMLALDRLLRDLHLKVVPVIDVVPAVTYSQLQSLRDAFHQFIFVFPSASTVGIGPRLTSLLVEITSSGTLQAEDVCRLMPIKSEQTVQLCGFVLHDNPTCLEQFPFNMSVVEYGFQANYDFGLYCKQYSDNGVPFSIMPGTAAWNSVAGCPEAAVMNIYSAAQTAVQHGALGLAVAHWAGVGHITHQTQAWPGLIAAAGLGWNANISCEFLNGHLAELINRHVVQDSSSVLGQAIIELGRAETYVVRSSLNMSTEKLSYARGQMVSGLDMTNLPAEKGSTLYQMLSNPDQILLEHLTPEVFQRTMRHVRKCQTELNKAAPQCPEGPEIISELQLTCDLMMSAARIGRALVSVGKNPSSGLTGLAVINLGVANLPRVQKTDLANRLLAQIDNYRRVWTSRNLPQGLQDSIGLMSVVLQQLLPDMDPADLQTDDTSSTPLLTPEYSN